MNLTTTVAGTKSRKMELFIGNLLRVGVYTSALLAIIGGIIYLGQNTEMRDYSVFQGTPQQYKNLTGIFNGVLNLDGAAIIQFAVIVLIATPILRILFSVFAFAIEKDKMYVLITLIVLSIILFGMFSGLGG